MSSVNVTIKSVFDDKGIKNAEKAFSGFGDTVRNTAGALAGVLGGALVVNFAKDAVLAASNLGAEFEGVNQTFGSAAESVQQFASQAANLVGVSETVALRAAKNFGGFATAAGLSGQAAADFSIDLVRAAGDLASFADVPVDEAIAAIGSGLAGSSEPLRKFQIFLDDTTLKAYAMEKGLGDTFDTMTQNEKTLLRQASLLDQMGVKQNDFVNYQDSFGNALKTVESQFADLQAEIGKAFIPALESVLSELRVLVPVLEQELVAAVNAVDWEGTAQAVGEFIRAFVDNIDEMIAFGETLLKFAPAILTIVTAYAGLKVALAAAEVAQLAFNIAVGKNPYVFAATMIVLGITSIIGIVNLLQQAFGGTAEETDKAAQSAYNLNNVDLSRLDGRLFQLQQSAIAARAALEGQSLIPASPTAGSKMPENPKPGQKYTFFNYSGPEGQAVWFEQTWTGTEWTKPKRMTYTPPGGSGQKEQKETTAQRFAKVQAVIKKAQKSIQEAERNYAGERFRIQQNYQDSVLRLETTAADRQLDIINQSKSRITDAFREASRIGLGDLFDKKTTTELETTVKQLTSRLTVTVTKETEKTAFASIDTVVKGLKDRLDASRTLLENASKLASEGFSQTFIEEVISAGTETGNALAGAIFDAAPETRAELKNLYKQLETVSETGAQTLADDLYETFGLATRGLKEESALVAQELKDSLVEQNKALAKSLADAGAAFGLAIRDIKETFLTDLDEFDGWFAGLGKTIDQLLGKMGQLQGKALTDTQKALTAATAGTDLAGASITQDVSIKNIKSAQGLVIDSMEDVAGTAAYLEARIKAANTYIKSSSSNAAQELSAAAKVADFTQQLANLRGAAATGAATGTVININVKTDTTQSRAMVGKTIGNIVTKYVTTGGQVLVSGNE